MQPVASLRYKRLKTVNNLVTLLALLLIFESLQRSCIEIKNHK